MKSRPTPRPRAIVALVLATCAACAWAQSESPLASSRETAQPGCEAGEVLNVRIGHVGPLTGAFGYLGLDNESGVRLAIEDLNEACFRIGGKIARFEIVPEDDAGDRATGVLAAQRLVGMRVHGVVGHLNSGTTIAAASVYAEAGIAQISPSVTNPEYTRLGYKTAFRLTAHDHAMGEVLGRYAVKGAKGRRIAIVVDQTAYGQGFAGGFALGVAKAGGTAIRHDVVNEGENEFTALVAKIKASKADLVFYGGMDREAGPFLRQMRRDGLDVKFISGEGACTYDLIELAGVQAVQGILCGEAGGIDEKFQPGMARFQKRFQQRFGTHVEIYAPFTYDAVHAIALAMQRAGSAEPARYLPALAAISFVGLTGPIAFDGKGDIRNGAITLHTFAGNRRVQIAVLH